MVDLPKWTALNLCGTDPQTTSYEGYSNGVVEVTWSYKWIAKSIVLTHESMSQAWFDESTHDVRWHHQQKWEVIRDPTLMLLVGIESNTRNDHLAIGDCWAQTLERLPSVLLSVLTSLWWIADLLKWTPLNSCETDQQMTSYVHGGDDGV